MKLSGNYPLNTLVLLIRPIIEFLKLKNNYELFPLQGFAVHNFVVFPQKWMAINWLIVSNFCFSVYTLNAWSLVGWAFWKKANTGSIERLTGTSIAVIHSLSSLCFFRAVTPAGITTRPKPSRAHMGQFTKTQL